MGARYETQHDPDDGTSYNIYDAADQYRSTVWKLEDAKDTVARIDALGGTPTLRELNPSAWEHLQARKKAHADRVAELQTRRDQATPEA